jgi:hypothetical protein
MRQAICQVRDHIRCASRGWNCERYRTVPRCGVSRISGPNRQAFSVCRLKEAGQREPGRFRSKREVRESDGDFIAECSAI